MCPRLFYSAYIPRRWTTTPIFDASFSLEKSMNKKLSSCLRLVSVDIDDIDKVIHISPLYHIFCGSTKIGEVGRSGSLTRIIDSREWSASISVNNEKDGVESVSMSGYGDTIFDAITDAFENGRRKITEVARALEQVSELQATITGIVVGESLLESEEAPVKPPKEAIKRRTLVRTRVKPARQTVQ